MKRTMRRRLARTVMFAGVSLLLLSLPACTGSGEPGDAEAATGAQASERDDVSGRTVNVEVRTVERSDFTERIRLTGTVRAGRDVRVAAEEGGRVRRIRVEKGAPVDAGQPLLELDDALLRAQVRQARARAELTREMWERRRRLWERDSVGTEAAYLEARADAADAAASLDLLEERLARTTVRAPFAGVVEERMVEVGEMVSSGTPLVRVVQLDTLEVTAGVPERFAPDVEPGAAATVTFDVLPGMRFEGAIRFVGATVDPGNRTFEVELELPNPERVVKPEMVADVSLVRRTLPDAIAIPQEALVRTEEGFRAFVVEETEDGPRVRARDVVLGPSQGDRAVVEEGLELGERLVVVGQQQVAAGDRVRIVGPAGPRR